MRERIPMQRAFRKQHAQRMALQTSGSRWAAIDPAASRRHVHA
jgi:hypothetical protein